MDQSELRIRVTFNNGVLTKPQKKDGLKHSWVLLKPYFETISDVVSYIVHSFDLHRSCPDGVILSMDGFVLPEFESISILKDTDIISVKRKETRLLDGGNKSVQEGKTRVEDVIVEKLPLTSGVQLQILANEEFDKQTVEDEVEDQVEDEEEEEEEEEEGEVRRSPVKTASNGDVACKKRKSSTKLQSAKKKRKIQAVVHASETITKSRKKRKHEHKNTQNALSSPDVVEKSSNDDLIPESNSKSELDENKEDTIQASPKPDKPKRVCRATFRKKQKRDYKRLQKEEAKKVERLLQLCGGGQKPVKDVTLDTGAILDAVAKVAQQPDDDDDDSDEDGELVPVEIRPGLIRFTSSAKAKDVQEMKEANAVDAHLPENGALDEHSAPKSVSDNQVAKEPYCWNGITNKKKGQKWGQTSTWKDSRNGNNTNSSNSWGDGRNQSTSSSYQESTEINNGELNRKWADKKYLLYKLRVDFDKLIPLVDLPKAGDVLAYRLLELSSSWCPELSEFRVGKIASFEPESNTVKLVPVPEYPLNLRKKNDDAEVNVDADESSPLGSSTYNEDGSLETDFTSLNDVRIIKLGESTRSKGNNGSSTPIKTTAAAAAAAKKDNGVLGSNAKKVASDVGNQEPPTAGLANGKKHVSEETSEMMSSRKTATSSSNGKKDVWDEISEAMSAKKAQLMQEDKWNKKKPESQTVVRRPWSYRSLRSSAIGPTMARLREQNGV